jgi:hypothetical protein
MDQYRSTMPRTRYGEFPVGYQASRGKGQYRNNGRVIMIIRTVMGKKDGKFHLYGQTMIGRTSPQQGKFNKRINNRKRGKQKSAIAEATKRHKGRERRNPWVDRNRLRTQQRSSHRPDRMVRMKRTNNKRNPQGKGTLNNPRWVSRMEQAEKDVEGTFHTLVAPKGKETITRLEKEINEKCKGKTWDALAQEADWVTDPGATQPRETLYHKMVEMAWKTKMLIGKVSSEREDARRRTTRNTRNC